jgi:hypothetical protein
MWRDWYNRKIIIMWRDWYNRKIIIMWRDWYNRKIIIMWRDWYNKQQGPAHGNRRAAAAQMLLHAPVTLQWYAPCSYAVLTIDDERQLRASQPALHVFELDLLCCQNSAL